MTTSNPDSAQKLSALRQWMRSQNISYLILPRTDQYAGEYIAAAAERVAWLSGFTGSAGTLVIGLQDAALFTDGRYTLQASDECDPALFAIINSGQQSPLQWLEQQLRATQHIGASIAYDPWLHSQQSSLELGKRLSALGAHMIALPQNPVDAIWANRPAEPQGLVRSHAIALAGESHTDKINRLAQELQQQGIDAAILTQADSIAWLLNIRGSDVPYNPLCQSYALLHHDGSLDWVVDSAKIPTPLRQQLGAAIRLVEMTDLRALLGQQRGKKIRIHSQSCAAAIAQQLEQAGALLQAGDDPCSLPKACKNNAEMAGMIACHRRDGAALVRFMAKLEQQPPKDELEAVQWLQQERAKDPLYVEDSFATIAGSGANGAIIHYRATAASNRPLPKNGLFLLDSGAQYEDGTTDVTRTFAIGNASIAEKKHYTLVLKGHLALSRARFPKGTSGGQLDGLARQFLWAEGLDYDHGTGHGVGAALSVHEGPARIAKKGSEVALQPGMVLSNEPGLYLPGQYGIRIENLLAVAEDPAQPGWYCFNTLTLAPYDKKLLDLSLLSEAEIAQINQYHQLVLHELSPLLDSAAQHYLQRACAPIGNHQGAPLAPKADKLSP